MNATQRTFCLLFLVIVPLRSLAPGQDSEHETTRTVKAQDAQQTEEISADKIMDAAFDLKKAAKRADELNPDGAKFCFSGRPRLDTSDLDDAIQRHLLNHGSHVPEHIPASAIWKVSFVAADLMRQLDLLGASCLTAGSFSREARNLFRDYSSVAARLRESLARFEDLAALQTLWQEQDLRTLKAAEKSESDRVRSELQAVLAVTRTMKDAEDLASQISSAESRKQSDCYIDDLSFPEFTSLSALLHAIESDPNDHFLLAGVEMVNVQLEAELSEMILAAADGLCLRRAAEKKKARQAAKEMIEARERLARSIVTFETLLVRQVEWEESILADQVIGKEH